MDCNAKKEGQYTQSAKDGPLLQLVFSKYRMWSQESLEISWRPGSIESQLKPKI